ncbi:hypothetical protein GCM10011503_27590 [Henriciella pelagia]|jgi:hypothetical protein|uniref:DUF4349 domain-containing protein n=1 Tax=Henriciella pelagia TaxID=1977912 RepID=A0ABQ1JUC9_9PROT|nr:hypothetical protein GCM10011503_27590 [Henriciella pelagia]
MKKLIVPALAAIMLAAACGGPGGGSPVEYDPSPSPPPPAPVMEMAADGVVGGMSKQAYSEAPSRPVEPDTPDAEPGVEQYIAYSHSLGMKLPKGGVDAMMQAHIEACKSAGTNTCIVINSNTYSYDEDRVNGNVSLRAKPEWIEQFLGAVDAATEAAGGEITSRSTRADDLTRQIIDTDSRLDAQRTLQTRLEGLLERRDGTLGDLLQIERELARVTGDIESIEAQLKALRLRVSMSSLDISYETIIPPFSSSRSNPLGEAFGNFFYNLSAAIGAVITAFAVGLPWLLLLGVFLWIWLKLIWPRMRGTRKKKATAADESKAT